MASLNGVVQRGAVKLDRPVNFKLSSFKSWLPHSQSPGSALRYLAPQLPRTTERSSSCKVEAQKCSGDDG
ncbi:hypothetical protein DVH24_027676 [Malus domestica]|uniref:Uncharacterized protein n=1 Tax=Malus domestica TaxID=3750 RepID=A0A498H965_MALDO|nr:hypothetical protein DVH24_027676 [Malus domestica]